jgi:hypothetical protein
LASLILGSLKGSEEQMKDKAAMGKGGDGAGATASAGGAREGVNAGGGATTMEVERGQPDKVRSDAKEDEKSSCGKGHSGEAADACIDAKDAGA